MARISKVGFHLKALSVAIRAIQTHVRSDACEQSYDDFKKLLLWAARRVSFNFCSRLGDIVRYMFELLQKVNKFRQYFTILQCIATRTHKPPSKLIHNRSSCHQNLHVSYRVHIITVNKVADFLGSSTGIPPKLTHQNMIVF